MNVENVAFSVFEEEFISRPGKDEQTDMDRKHAVEASGQMICTFF